MAGVKIKTGDFFTMREHWEKMAKEFRAEGWPENEITEEKFTFYSGAISVLFMFRAGLEKKGNDVQGFFNMIVGWEAECKDVMTEAENYLTLQEANDTTVQ